MFAVTECLMNDFLTNRSNPANHPKVLSHCPKNNLNTHIKNYKTEPVTAEADGMVYVWFLARYHIFGDKSSVSFLPKYLKQLALIFSANTNIPLNTPYIAHHLPVHLAVIFSANTNIPLNTPYIYSASFPSPSSGDIFSQHKHPA